MSIYEASTSNVGTIEELKEDIREAAASLSLPISEVTWEIVNAFEQELLENPIGFRVTSKDSELNVRYTTLKPGDAYGKLVDHGFLKPDGHPVYDVMAELQEKHPEGGYFIDIGVTHGIDKIWGFFTDPLHIEEVAAMESMPEGFGKQLDLFKKYDMHWIGAIGVNYHSKYVNVYFMQGSYPNDAEISRQFTIEAGFPEPSPFDCELNGGSFCVYMSFTWDSDEIVRLTYGCAGSAADIPEHWPEKLHDFARNVPIRGEARSFTFNVAYCKDREDYYKTESDYRHSIPATVGPLIQGNIAAYQNMKNDAS